MTRRERLERLMRHPVTDAAVMVLIVFSVALLIVGLSVPYDSPQRHTTDMLGYLVTLIFAVELSLRWWAEPRKRRFFEKYWIDCLAVLPAFRFFRFLWVLRLLRVFRFGLLMSRRLSGYSALVRTGATEAMMLVAVVTALVLAGGVGVNLAESKGMGFETLEASMWWSVLSLVAGEPVGQTPTTTAGRLVTLGVMTSGLIVFAVVTGVVSANMVDRLRRLNLREMELEDLRNHVIICGWNPAAVRVIRELQLDKTYKRRGVVCIAEFEQEPSLIDVVPSPAHVFFLSDDPTRPDVLHKAGIEHASRAIVLADRVKERSDQDRDARSVLTALLIENINQEHDKDIFTSVELLNRDNAQSLEKAGVEEIVVADEYVGRILAASSRNIGMTSIIDELLTVQYGNQFLKTWLPPDLEPISVGELSNRLRDRCDAILIALQDDTGDMHVNPAANMVVCGGDIVVVVARGDVDARRLR